MTFFGTKTKNKTNENSFSAETKKPKMTKQFIFGAENENEFCLMAWPEWPWPPQILQQIYATE